MLIAAFIIYTIFAFLVGPFWPLDVLAGKAGFLGYLLLIGWIILLIAGIAA